MCIFRLVESLIYLFQKLENEILIDRNGIINTGLYIITIHSFREYSIR